MTIERYPEQQSPLPEMADPLKTQWNPVKFLWNTLKGLGQDIREAPLKASVAATSFATAFVWDRYRQPMVNIADEATNTLSEGSNELVDGALNSLHAGVQGGALFAIHYFLIGMGSYAAARQLKNSREQVTSQAPRLEPVARHSTQVTGVGRRAGMGFLIGTAADGCIAGLDDDSPVEAAVEIGKTSLSAGAVAVVPAIMAVDALTDYFVRQGNYDAAENVVDVVSNRYAWILLAFAGMALTYRSNTKIAREALAQ